MMELRGVTVDLINPLLEDVFMQAKYAVTNNEATVMSCVGHLVSHITSV
jgi:hypothetical protein